MSDNPCEVNGDQSVSDMIADRYAQRMSALGNNLLHGTLSLDQFHESLQDAIRLSFIHQTIAGSPEGDERLITAADKQRIEAGIANQYEYLDGFMSDIEAAVEEEGASLNFIPNRASLYAGAGKSAFWQQAVSVDLPNTPGDGSTSCGGRCSCSVRTECEYDDNGNPVAVLAYWDLDPSKEEVHCDDCPARAEEWNPLRIPIGVNA